MFIAMVAKDSIIWVKVAQGLTLYQTIPTSDYHEEDSF